MVILGASGVGKTTLLRLMAGLLTAKRGTIDITRSLDKPASRLVFQEPRLFPWLNVEQNLCFALKAAGIAKKEWLHRIVPLLQVVGLEDALHLPVQALSGGMAQRIALVRGLCVQPNLLLLDEPFGSLDPQLRVLLQDALIQLIEFTKVSVVMVSHDIDEALRIGDQVIVLTGQPAGIGLQLTNPKSDMHFAQKQLREVLFTKKQKT